MEHEVSPPCISDQPHYGPGAHVNEITRNPEGVSKAYTPDSIWRNRDTFLRGREEIVKFLTDKWSKENGYRLRKELFAFTENKVSGSELGFLVTIFSDASMSADDEQIAVQFWYEWYDVSGQWWRTYGLEDWTFAEDGLMRKRQMSANDVRIDSEARWFKDGVDVNTVDISEMHW